MNRRLTERAIRETLGDLLRQGQTPTGRGLCAELKRRFGAVGRTERVFRIWRATLDQASKPAATIELEQRLKKAEALASELLARAERAELREQAHQDYWGLEIDRLRREVSELRGAPRSKPFAV